MLDKMGIESHFINGLRYTTRETMHVVQMVLCGKVNKNLVDRISRIGGKAVGLSGLDSALIQAKKLDRGDGEDYGLVGEITQVNPEVLETSPGGRIHPHCGHGGPGGGRHQTRDMYTTSTPTRRRPSWRWRCRRKN